MPPRPLQVCRLSQETVVARECFIQRSAWSDAQGRGQAFVSELNTPLLHSLSAAGKCISPKTQARKNSLRLRSALIQRMERGLDNSIPGKTEVRHIRDSQFENADLPVSGCRDSFIIRRFKITLYLPFSCRKEASYLECAPRK